MHVLCKNSSSDALMPNLVNQCILYVVAVVELTSPFVTSMDIWETDRNPEPGAITYSLKKLQRGIWGALKQIAQHHWHDTMHNYTPFNTTVIKHHMEHTQIPSSVQINTNLW